VTDRPTGEREHADVLAEQRRLVGLLLNTVRAVDAEGRQVPDGLSHWHFPESSRAVTADGQVHLWEEHVAQALRAVVEAAVLVAQDLLDEVGRLGGEPDELLRGIALRLAASENH
jgi:hypothetical protein